jgi:2,4-dienoyl-CoA reductase-like NADH-dependent reductase (Old Yellow Enzyme family)
VALAARSHLQSRLEVEGKKMSALFQPVKIGALSAANRFVRSATHEDMADADGRVTPAILKLYRALARGGIGTIISGFMYVHKDGRGNRWCTGIDRDELVPGLAGLADVMKDEGSLAIFQIYHAGGQTRRSFTGSRPRGPSGHRRDPIMLEKPLPLRLEEIGRVAADFGAAARRAKEAGADGVQVHAGHGYLLSEFLSPFFNDREDLYGGSREGRYRLLGEVIHAVRRAVGPESAVMVKMNIDDGTPEPGVTPELAAYYASRMVTDGIDCLEISAGSTTWAPFVMCRGAALTKDFARAAPWPVSLLADRRLKATARPPFVEAYNAPQSGPVKAALGKVPLALVGGMRTLARMEECVSSGTADLVSLSRPFVREPGLANHLRTDPTTMPTCTSCSRCLAAVFNGLPLRCYINGLPAKPGRGRRSSAGS